MVVHSFSSRNSFSTLLFLSLFLLSSWSRAAPQGGGSMVGTIFNNHSIHSVKSGPSDFTMFKLEKSTRVTGIQTYHWNQGRGSAPGSISLHTPLGKVFGPWKCKGVAGQNNVPNAYWECHPNTVLPPGRYLVVDSAPATWSHNIRSQGCGMTRIDGGDQSKPLPQKTTADGYPDISGRWKEAGITFDIRMSSGGVFFAKLVCPSSVWVTTGTISKSGVLKGTLIHERGVSPTQSWYRQKRTLQLSADGMTLKGEAIWPPPPARRQGNSTIIWKRVVDTSSSVSTLPVNSSSGSTLDEYPNIGGNWSEKGIPIVIEMFEKGAFVAKLGNRQKNVPGFEMSGTISKDGVATGNLTCYPKKGVPWDNQVRTLKLSSDGKILEGTATWRGNGRSHIKWIRR